MSKAAVKEAKDFIEFESTNVHSAKFDPARKVIVVRFHSGTAGEYAKCDYKLWKAMNAAKSLGSFLHKELKPGHEWTRIDDWK